MKLDLTVSGDKDTPIGETDAAIDLGRRIALEAGRAAERLAGPGCRVVVEREIVAY